MCRENCLIDYGEACRRLSFQQQCGQLIRYRWRPNEYPSQTPVVFVQQLMAIRTRSNNQNPSP